MEYGFIYKATSPSGKSYIGQTISKIEHRWREHIYDAETEYKNRCKVLNNAIRKYGPYEFQLTCLEECARELLDEKEAYYIKLYDTMQPNGYNIKQGGSSHRHTEETKRKIKETLKKRYEDPAQRAKLRDRLLNNRKNSPKLVVEKETLPPPEKKPRQTRRRFTKDALPKYIVRIRDKEKVLVGYRVEGHSNQSGSKKLFTSKEFSLEEKLQQAINYVTELNNMTEPIVRQVRILPKYIRNWQNGMGYYVKSPYGPEKWFLSKFESNEQLLNKAVEYLNQLMSATCLDTGEPLKPSVPS